MDLHRRGHGGLPVAPERRPLVRHDPGRPRRLRHGRRGHPQVNAHRRVRRTPADGHRGGHRLLGGLLRGLVGADRAVDDGPPARRPLLPHHRHHLPAGRRVEGLHRPVHHPPGGFRVDAHGARGAVPDAERQGPRLRQCRALHERAQPGHHRPPHHPEHRLPPHCGRDRQRRLRGAQRNDPVLLRLRGSGAQHLPGNPHRRGAALGDDLPWIFLAPAAVVVIMLVCVNFMGDGLRDAVDPSSKSGGQA